MLKLAGFSLFVALMFHFSFGYQSKEFDKCISKEKVDGCSIPFNTSFPYRVVFRSACNRHDVCYRCGKSFGWSRKECDSGFLHDLYRECEDQKWMKKHIKSNKEKKKKEENINERSSKTTAEKNWGSRGQVPKKRQRRSEVKAHTSNDQRLKQRDTSSDNEKQLKEMENDLFKEAMIEIIAKRQRNKMKCKGMNKKRHESGSKKETIEVKTSLKSKKGQGNKSVTNSSKLIKAIKKVFINSNTSTTENNVTKSLEENSTIKAGKYCNELKMNCSEKGHSTHNSTANRADLIGKTGYTDIYLNNKSISRHEKILKILKWLDELLRSEKEMYAHDGKTINREKIHQTSDKSTKETKSRRKEEMKNKNKKKQLRRERTNKTTKKKPVIEEDIDGFKKRGNGLQSTGSDAREERNDVTKKGSDIKNRRVDAREERNDVTKKGSVPKEIGSDIKNRRADAREGRNNAKKESVVRGRDVKKTGSDVTYSNHISKKEIEKRLVSHCKLTAHLYYLAVRGFGARFYRQQPEKWCDHTCVEDNGLPHIKKNRGPRNMM